MKVTELLEARKEKSADDLSVNPSARVGRIIKSMIGRGEPSFGQLIQGASQPKKAGDAIVNIEVGEKYEHAKRVPYDLAQLAGDMAPEIRDKIAARQKAALEKANEAAKKKAAEAKDRAAARKEFMLTLLKRVKAELSGLKEVGYKQDDEAKNKYVYVPVDKFDPEKLIKNWDRNIRFKFAFSSEVHSQKFEMGPELMRMSEELPQQITAATGLEVMKQDAHSMEYMRFLPPKKYVAAYIKDPKNIERADKKIEVEKKEGRTAWPTRKSDLLNAWAQQDYADTHWPADKKKIRELIAQTKTPLRAQLTGGSYGYMQINWMKPKASDLKSL